ncbi:DUF998 domain-containing protein [Actinoplanes sp. CA-142083]|uniref:DUF998 domain-containing protein n=1 Tax=Actinoplanes sp. CA-142083 TaxID=3239903 RepID=UPI003D8ABA83
MREIERGPVLGGIAVVVLLALHCLPDAGGVDPVRETLSEYPVRSAGLGVLFVLALLCANAATALLGAGMARRGLLRVGAETALLVIWCVSLLGLTVFLKDPLGAAGTWYGEVHKACATINFVSLPALGALLWWRFRRAARWRAFAVTAGLLAAASLACATPFAAAFLLHDGSGAAGLVERGVVALDVALIATLAAWSRAMADAPSARRPTPC